MENTSKAIAITPEKQAQADHLCETIWLALKHTNVVELTRDRKDMMTWRRGSAQIVLKVNPSLNNVSIYSILVAGVFPSEALFRYLLSYNVLQRRESLGLMERDGKMYIVLKYTMEMEVATEEVLQRHVYAIQEIADELDTELVKKFGGSLHFDDWEKLDQNGVDNMLDSLFG